MGEDLKPASRPSTGSGQATETQRSNGIFKFQLTRKDLFEIIRITASQRPFRRVAMPGLAGFVFLGHAIDGNYDKGIAWAIIVGFLYWSISYIMFWLNVYGAGNETLLAPQEIQLADDMMVVTSEHSTEKFLRPDPSDVKVAGGHVVINTSTGKLVFLEGSFEIPGDFQVLKNWLMSGHAGNGETVKSLDSARDRQ